MQLKWKFTWGCQGCCIPWHVSFNWLTSRCDGKNQCRGLWGSNSYRIFQFGGLSCFSPFEIQIILSFVWEIAGPLRSRFWDVTSPTISEGLELSISEGAELSTEAIHSVIYHYGPCKRSQRLLANETQHCWAQHVASVCTPCCVLLRLVGSCRMKFETGQTSSNNFQQAATTRNNTQHGVQTLVTCWA